MLYAAYPRTTAEVNVHAANVRACSAVTVEVLQWAEESRQEGLTGGGCYTSVQLTRQPERCKVLDRVENGHSGDNELPFG